MRGYTMSSYEVERRMQEAKAIEAVLQSAGPVYDGGTAERRRALAADWRDYGFAPKDVEDWVREECWDPGTASQLRAMGYIPKWHKLRSARTATPMYGLCEGNVNVDDVTW
jgi:hypothetical protein